MDGGAVEAGKKRTEAIFQPNFPVIFYTTGIVILAGSICIPLWFKYDPMLQILSNFYTTTDVKPSGHILISKEELATYSAKASNGKIYLAILGKVFDVTMGKQHYGKGGSYSFFTGIDGTKAFVSGDFNKVGLVDNIDTLTDDECVALNDWVKFYENEYTYIGKVIGNFYDKDGNETLALKDFYEKLKRGTEAKEQDNEDKKTFPECNSKWSKEEGTLVWCTNESGGVKRDWTGVPRMFFTPGQTDHRCACVQEKLLRDSRVRLYPGCGVTEVSCKVQ